MPKRLTRLPISSATKDVYEKLRDTLNGQSAYVLTYKGEDFLLVFDARQAHRIGVERFLRENVGVAAASPQVERWINAIAGRFTKYAEDSFAVDTLASVWHDSDTLKVIDRVFFLKFFNDGLLRPKSSRPNYGGTPENAERLAVVSLRARPASPPRKESVARPPEFKITSRASRNTRDVVYPTTMWFQLPNPTRTKARIVTWDCESSRKPGRDRLADDFLRSVDDWSDRAVDQTFYFPRLPSARVKSVDAIDIPGVIYETQISETEDFIRYSVRAVLPATAPQILFMQSDLVQEQLEPSAKIESPLGPLFIPARYDRVVGRTTLATLTSLFGRLEDRGEGAKLAIAGLAPGHTVAIGLTPKTVGVASDSRPSREIQFRENTFVFFRDGNGRLYLTGRIESKVSDLVR